MKKLVLTMMVALMTTVGVCAQKVRRPDTYNFNRAMELVENGELDDAPTRVPNKYRFNAVKYAELKQRGFRLEF